jgi:uncharacterized membrane protein YeaQ/YmgE (transglycosylase-associated protein family)
MSRGIFTIVGAIAGPVLAYLPHRLDEEGWVFAVILLNVLFVWVGAFVGFCVADEIEAKRGR